MDFNIELAQSLLDSPDQFPVDFEQAWQWLGYTRKDSALKTLKNYFIFGEDFALRQSAEWTRDGRSSDFYVLTTNCLKEFGMVAKTEQGRLIRKYFLECETIAKQAIAHQSQTTTPELPVVMPTQKELDYMRSRAWEKAEMMGTPVSAETLTLLDLKV